MVEMLILRGEDIDAWKGPFWRSSMDGIIMRSLEGGGNTNCATADINAQWDYYGNVLQAASEIAP